MPSWRQLTSWHVWGWHELLPSHEWLQVHDLVKALSKCVHQAFPITTEPAKAFHSGQSTYKLCPAVRRGRLPCRCPYTLHHVSSCCTHRAGSAWQALSHDTCPFLVVTQPAVRACSSHRELRRGDTPLLLLQMRPSLCMG